MAKDFKNRVKSGGKKPVTGRTWFLIGFVFGAFVVGLLWIKFGAEPGEPIIVEVPRNASKNTTNTTPEPESSFSFYTLLPKIETFIPDEEVDDEAKAAALAAKAEKTKPAAKQGQNKKTKVRYWLQAGSFKKASDAERHKAELALQGLEAKISSFQIGTTTYYRVRLGPFDALSMRKTKKQLTSFGVKSIVFKVSG